MSFPKRLASRIGIHGGLAIAAAWLLLLPLDVIAATRLTGWVWWMALGGVIAVNLVPVLGQLVYVGLAVVGAFYLGQESRPYRTQAGVTPPAPVISGPKSGGATTAAPSLKAPSAPDKFIEWKKTVAAPAIQANCIDEAGKRGLVEGRQIEQMARVCACYGAAAVNIVTQADVVDDVVQASPDLNARLSDEARRLCRPS